MLCALPSVNKDMVAATISPGSFSVGYQVTWVPVLQAVESLHHDGGLQAFSPPANSSKPRPKPAEAPMADATQLGRWYAACRISPHLIVRGDTE